MTTAYTSLLGLALPVTGELSGTWGDVVNNSITSLLDSAVAGTTNVSTDGDVTLTTTTGAANTAREAILLFSGARTALRTVTAPAQSKVYTVINATTGGFSVKLVGAGPTTGVTILAGESAVCAWNGSDFIKVSNSSGAGVFTSITNTGLTSGRVVYSTTGGLETDSANLTFNGTTLTAGGLTTTGTTSTGVLSVTGNTTLGDAAADNVTVNGTVTSNLIFTDNTYDIGASGATRPRNLFLAGNATIGGSIAATTLDLTNLEVTNIKAKDGTASITIADSTGAVSFANNVTLGDASTDTVRVNGYMGVGGAASGAYGLYVLGDTTTGTSQYGVASLSTLSGTTWSASVLTGPLLKASTGYSDVAGFRAINATTASGATVARQYGLYIDDQTLGTSNYGVYSGVSSGSNKYNINAGGTAQNYFAGNVGVKVSAPSESLSVACSSTTDNTFNPAIVVGPSGTGTQGGFIGSRTASANQLQGLYVRSNQTLTLWGDATGDGDLVLEVVSGASPSASTSANALLQLYATGSFVTLPTVGGTAVFNENGVDADFRIESDNNGSAFVVDAGLDQVIVGSNSGISGSTNNIPLVVRYSSGPATRFYSNVSATQIATTGISLTTYGSSRYAGYQTTGGGGLWTNSSNGTTTFITSPSTAGIVRIGNFNQDPFENTSVAFVEYAQLNSSETVFNDESRDIDFRVESDTSAYALYMEASVSRVGINNSSPYQALSVTGAIEAGTSSATNGSIAMYNKYAGETNDYIALWGAQFSSGGPTMAYGLSSSGGTAWNSTYDNFSGTHSVLVLDGSNLRFYSDETSSATTVGSPVTVYERMTISRNEAVFNEDSRDVDFRVESDTNTHALFVEAGSSYVSMGTSGNINNGTLHVLAAASRQAITAQVTSDGNSLFQGFSSAGGGAVFQVTGTGALTANAQITTNGNLFVGGSASTTTPALDRAIYLQDTTNNGTIGYSMFINDGANNRRGSMFLNDSTGVFGFDITASSGVPIYTFYRVGNEYFHIGDDIVVNDNGYDVDFRVESDASTHMLFVDAGNNRVGINQSTPLASLDVGDSEIRQGGITTAVRTASNSTGAAIFLSQFGDVPITGWIHAVETGTSKYLILACYKESNAAAVTTTTLASNGLGVQATNSGGTVTLNGFTTGANVKMVAYVIGTTGAD